MQVFEPLEEQEHGISALEETIARLDEGNGAGVAFDYAQLRDLLEAANGQMVALEPPPEPEPEESRGIFDELALRTESSHARHESEQQAAPTAPACVSNPPRCYLAASLSGGCPIAS